MNEYEHTDGGMHDHAPALDLGADERLPWLESADDIDADPHRGGARRWWVAGLIALAALALLVDGIYWLTHRSVAPKAADGSMIEASRDPYKVAPSDPGGKQFAGTGDSSFKVSQGEHPDASLAGNAGTTPPPANANGTPATATTGAAAPAAVTPSSAAPSSAAPAHTTPVPVAAAKPGPARPAASGGGVAVQVGAFSSNALAEAAWSHLVAAHDMLGGLSHRVIEGKADIGTVYRLQAMSGDVTAANSLCSRLQGDGVKCQVKH